MGWGWGVGGYAVLWWMVLFTLLPWGWRTRRPGLAVKAMVATVAAAVLWGAVRAVSLWGVISLG